MKRWLRNAITEWQLDRALERRRAARAYLSERAQAGQSTRWTKARENRLKLFPWSEA